MCMSWFWSVFREQTNLLYLHSLCTEIPLWHHMGIQTYLECLFKNMEPAKSSAVFSLQYLWWYAWSNLPLANHSSSTSSTSSYHYSSPNQFSTSNHFSSKIPSIWPKLTFSTYHNHWGSSISPRWWWCGLWSEHCCFWPARTREPMKTSYRICSLAYQHHLQLSCNIIVTILQYM